MKKLVLVVSLLSLLLTCCEKGQAPVPEEQEYVFSIDPPQVDVPSAGGTIMVTVTCSGAYHINTMPAWLHESLVQGNQHIFTVDANEGDNARSGPIVFCDEIINEELGGTCIPCIVKQAGKAE